MDQNTTKIAITFPSILVQKASLYSLREYGMKFPEFVRHLLARFLDEHKEESIELLDQTTVEEIGLSLSNIEKGEYAIIDALNDGAMDKALGVRQ